MSRRPLRSPSVLAAVTATLVGATLAPSATATASATPALTSSAVHGTAPAHAGTATRTASYSNPVSRGFADTFADPSLVRAKDGYWYSYGTSDPLREGEGTPHRIPIARSADLVSWTHVGDAFSDATLPSWAEKDAGIWAPDIRYVDGQYRMYYVVTQTTVTSERDDNAVGMATAPTPAGPWKDSGHPVVGPRRGGQVGDGNFLWTFDPTAVTDTDGSQWLFYGSYYGGLFTTRLSDDGTRAVGTPVQVAIDNKFEGSYVVRRDGYWYLFASTANCCAGPTTGYSVQVGRSRSLQGPYVDRQGARLTDSRAGGTPVLNQNGNRWVGAGHNAIATDLAGQDWIAYHAIDRNDPYLDGTSGINERPMLLDRLDWVDGWPTVRAGQGPSERSEQAPVTGGRVATTFSRGDGDRLSPTGRWTRAQDAQSGTYLRSDAGRRRPHPVLRHRGRAGRGRPAFLRRGVRAGRVRPRQGRDPAGHRPQGRHGNRAPGRPRSHLPHGSAAGRVRRRRLALRHARAPWCHRHRAAEQRPARRPARRPADHACPQGRPGPAGLERPPRVPGSASTTSACCRPPCP